jgi:hypothetical protein
MPYKGLYCRLLSRVLNNILEVIGRKRLSHNIRCYPGVYLERLSTTDKHESSRTNLVGMNAFILRSCSWYSFLKRFFFSKTMVVHNWPGLFWSPSCAHVSKANTLMNYCLFTANTGGHGRSCMQCIIHIPKFLTVHHPRKLLCEYQPILSLILLISDYTSLFHLSTYF